MTDTTDDIAEEISFQGFDDYCKLLKNLLNDVLQREVGTDFVEKLERNRTLAQVFFLFFYFSFFFLERSYCDR
jgi:phosphoenolpyruvate carboxylase